MLEEHLEWANASYYHSSEGTVNSNPVCCGLKKDLLFRTSRVCRGRDKKAREKGMNSNV